MSIAGCSLVMSVFVLQAAPEAARVRETAYARVRLAQGVAQDAAILKAVAAQNAKKESLESVQAKDAAWVKDAKHPLRREVLAAPCSARLKTLVGEDPVVVEAFVMDARGALVCSVGETSDYWQGDEPKWQRTFSEGKPAFVDEPAFDASSNTYAIQVSVPLSEAGRRTGALTLTLRLNRQGGAGSR
jgi:hypothetical protein